MLFLPVCVDEDLEQMSLPFCGVKMLDGREKKFQALLPELFRSLVTWLESGDMSPMFPVPEVGQVLCSFLTATCLTTCCWLKKIPVSP